MPRSQVLLPELDAGRDLVDGWMPPEADQAWTLLKADITKAHRRIKVLKPDWKYQVAQLGPKAWWVNKVDHQRLSGLCLTLRSLPSVPDKAGLGYTCRCLLPLVE